MRSSGSLLEFITPLLSSETLNKISLNLVGVKSDWLSVLNICVDTDLRIKVVLIYLYLFPNFAKKELVTLN